MNLSYRWLRDFVDIDLPAAELADALVSLGLEVASMTDCRVPHGVKVGIVESVGRHPGADRLSLCRVNIGGPEPLLVVCGAPNVRAGMRAPLATPGTRIGDLVVKEAAIRGVESCGMLCSERELGLSDDHSGIMELPQDFEAGAELSSFIPDDSILSIEITPDRGDCLSVLGMAREICARYRLALRDTMRRPRESAEKVDAHVGVHIESPELCPRYTGRMVRGVRIGPSPFWMQRRLIAAGVRPISNVVDVTNYVMLHCGQPMHAFDHRLIGGNRIVVRRALNEEKLTTLDGVERTLCTEDLLICDGERPIALAGIMGGEGSAISPSTSDIFLECAFFDPVGIRKTSKRLGLTTDSSYRFERGVDYEDGLIDALDFAASLISETAGGTVVQGTVDEYPRPIASRHIPLRPRQVKRLLGIEIEASQARSILESLRIGFEGQSEGVLRFRAPSFRHDLHLEADLIEEVGRMYGYDNLPAAQQATISLVRTPRRVENGMDAVRRVLSSAGIREIVTNSMTSEKRRALLTPDTRAVKLLNPLSPEMGQLRTTLLGNCLEAIGYNINRKNEGNRFFEIGNVFEDTDPGNLPRERTVLAIALEGDFWPSSWNTPRAPSSFFVLKGTLANLARALGTEQLVVEGDGEFPVYLGTERGSVRIGSIAGSMGKIAGNIISAFDLGSDVYYAELDLTDFLVGQPSSASYSALPRYPAVERDFCFIMPEQVEAQRVSEVISSVSELVESVRPFDLYRGEKIDAGKKSIAYAVRLRSAERTLTDHEAVEISESIIRSVSQKFGATLR